MRYLVQLPWPYVKYVANIDREALLREKLKFFMAQLKTIKHLTIIDCAAWISDMRLIIEGPVQIEPELDKRIPYDIKFYHEVEHDFKL